MMGRIVGLGALPKRTFVYNHHKEVSEERVATGGGSTTQEQLIQRVKDLAKALNDMGSNKWARKIAAEDLEEIGKAEEEAVLAVPELAKALRDEVDVCKYAARALVAIGKKSASIVISELAKALSDTKYYTREYAALALSDMGKAAAPAVPELAKAVGDDNEDTAVRKYAALALGRIGEEAALAVPELAKALSNSCISTYHSSVCSYAILALGRIGKAAASAVPELTKVVTNAKALTVPDWYKRAISYDVKMALKEIQKG